MCLAAQRVSLDSCDSLSISCGRSRFRRAAAAVEDRMSLFCLSGRLLNLGILDFDPRWSRYGHVTVVGSNGWPEVVRSLHVPSKLDAVIRPGNDVELYFERTGSERHNLLAVRHNGQLLEVLGDQEAERKAMIWVWGAVLALALAGTQVFLGYLLIPFAMFHSWRSAWRAPDADRYRVFIARSDAGRSGDPTHRPANLAAA